jgi:hypothetical protein
MKKKKLNKRQALKLLLFPSLMIISSTLLLLINNVKIIWILMVCLYSIIIFFRYLLQQIGRLFYREIFIPIPLNELLDLIDVIVAETRWEYGEITNEAIELKIRKLNQPTMIFYIIHEEKRLYLHCLHEKISYFDFMDKTTRVEIDWFETKVQEQLDNRHVRAIIRREITVEKQQNRIA